MPSQLEENIFKIFENAVPGPKQVPEPISEPEVEKVAELAHVPVVESIFESVSKGVSELVPEPVVEARKEEWVNTKTTQETGVNPMQHYEENKEIFNAEIKKTISEGIQSQFINLLPIVENSFKVNRIFI